MAIDTQAYYRPNF